VKLLHLVADPGVPLLGPSGASHHVRDLAQGFVEADHDVHLFGARDVDRRGRLGELSLPFTVTGVAGWPSWLKRWEHQREVRTARRLAHAAIEHALGQSQPIDLVVERYSLFSDAGWKVADRLGVPLVLEVNAPLARERGLVGSNAGSAAQAWEPEILRAATRVVAVSTWLVRWLIDEIGCAPARVVHLPNGVRDETGDRAKTRTALGISPDQPLLGFIGSFRPWHGLDALPALLEAWPEAHLLLVGADRAGGLPDWVERLGRRVHAVGRVPAERVADYAAAMDIGLAPYPAEAPPWFCPLKIGAYRAQGTPVVATDVGDNALAVEDGGLVVPAGDADAFLNACQNQFGQRKPVFRRRWSDVADRVVALAVGSADLGR
jgi:glycosyltransferase involved in cell wall biosynthesis